MENYSHIFLQGNALAEQYTSPQSGGSSQNNIPQRDRMSHSDSLLQKFTTIWEQQQQLNQQRQAAHIPTRDGTYLSFKSSANSDLITKSLENLRGKDESKWIRLLNIQTKEDETGEKISIATVYIPRGKEGYFVKKIQDYRDKNYRDSDKPQNADLINSIEDVSLSLLESLWTDKIELLPDDNSKWCEVWLNVKTKEQQEQEQIALFKSTLERIEIEHKPNYIIFPERAVMLINANRNQLIELMAQSDLLAEFRAGQEPAGFWVNESASEQQNWVEDLLSRISVIDSNVKVCILDSGVNSRHQLLEPILDNANTLTVNPTWGTHDHYERSGHGTLMAGVAGYGELERALATRNEILLSHKLCSVKILPPPSQDGTPIELWGDITQQGIARAEVQNPDTNLVYCMAVTSTEDIDKGRPSSWSGAIDNVTFGDGNDKKLAIISAGNISSDNWTNYPDSNLTSSVQNPAQSWNALTVGAYTEKVVVNDQRLSNHAPLANVGELSPHSTTSLVWEKIWPFKPDVVFEGGNLLLAPDGSVIEHEDLELLSTSKLFNSNIAPKIFDTINATSVATAQASWFAAKIAYLYPNAWAETIRGLIVHSARWQDSMFNQLDIRQNSRSDLKNLLKVFGYGVPDLDTALYSQESALTFIAEELIQPFRFNESNQPATNQIHIFNLPWPKDLLLDLGNIDAKLKITLSYFIQPGAGEIGWKDKYRYQSHGLRFDVNNSDENLDTFRKRINAAARDEEDEIRGGGGNDRWKLGKNNQKNGSVHSDIWEGTAAELATCHYIAVYPVIGWWRERKHLGKVENQTRYSLIISLETPTQDVELYTTVRNMIEVPIEIQITE